MTAYVGSYAKTANESVDLTFSWASHLGSDTIAGSVFTISPSGLTTVATSNTTTTTTIRVSGGIALTEYVITNQVTTAVGQVFEQQLLVLVDPLLTPTQLADLQADLGLTNNQAVFTDGALNRLYARADNDYDTTVALALWQLLTNASKLHNYTAGAVREELQQVRNNLADMYDRAAAKAGLNTKTLESGVLSLGLDQTDADQWLI